MFEHDVEFNNKLGQLEKKVAAAPNLERSSSNMELNTNTNTNTKSHSLASPATVSSSEASGYFGAGRKQPSRYSSTISVRINDNDNGDPNETDNDKGAKGGKGKGNVDDLREVVLRLNAKEASVSLSTTSLSTTAEVRIEQLNATEGKIKTTTDANNNTFNKHHHFNTTLGRSYAFDYRRQRLELAKFLHF